MEPRGLPLPDGDVPSPTFRAVVPREIEALPDEPFVPLDLDAFERWARTGEGDPWTPGA